MRGRVNNSNFKGLSACIKIDKQAWLPYGPPIRNSPERSSGFVCILADTLRVHYAGVATTECRGDEQVDQGVGDRVRGVNRKRATCGKWKWTKYRCKHSTVRVSIYDAPSSISPGLLIPLLLRAKAHTRAHKGPRFHGPFVVYTGAPAPRPRLTPSFSACAHGRTSTGRSRPVKIHRSLESIRYPQNIARHFSLPFSFLRLFVSPRSVACTCVKSRERRLLSSSGLIQIPPLRFD